MIAIVVREIFFCSVWNIYVGWVCHGNQAFVQCHKYLLPDSSVSIKFVLASAFIKAANSYKTVKFYLITLCLDLS